MGRRYYSTRFEACQPNLPGGSRHKTCTPTRPHAPWFPRRNDMSDSDPRVAVVMITYNRRDEVLRSLGHLTTLPERPRIVLVDNGSTDGTAAGVTQHFPPAELLD